MAGIVVVDPPIIDLGDHMDLPQLWNIGYMYILRHTSVRLGCGSVCVSMVFFYTLRYDQCYRRWLLARA